MPGGESFTFPILGPKETNGEFDSLFDLPTSLKDIIVDDEVEMFVRCMMDKFPCPQNGYGLLGAVEKDALPTYCPKNIASFIITHHAVNCATALLQGETGLTLDPNHPCLLGRYPLHDAASLMSYDLVDLLLSHGAKADVRTTEAKPFTRGGLLPLNVALENFRLHRYLLAWTPKQSIFMLIIIFCLPQMKAPLEICKLLALSTMDVVEVFNGYCMDGKLIEVVALLMVAREKLIDTVSGRLMIHKHIVREISQLTNEEIKLRMSSKSVRACKNRIRNLQNTLLVLEVFEGVGDAIGTYVQIVHNHVTHTSKEDVVNEVKRLLVEGGFLLTQRDFDLSDIDCEDGNIKLASEILEIKLRNVPHGISLLGGSWWERERVALKTSKEDVVNEVKRLLVEGGFLLTQRDFDLSDIDCEDGNIKLASEILEIKLRNVPHGISLLGGSWWEREKVALKVLYNKNKIWAMRGFFARIPVLWHGQDLSRRNLLLRRPVHSIPLPWFLSISRGYISIAWAANKGLSCFRI